MSVVLVVEQDASYREQIVQALGSEGWTVRTSDHPDDAKVQARSQPPQLVIASAALPNVRHFLAPFSMDGGGTGAVVLVPTTLVGRVSPADYHADLVVPKPFEPEELRQAARRLLRPAESEAREEPAASPPAIDGPMRGSPPATAEPTKAPATAAATAPVVAGQAPGTPPLGPASMSEAAATGEPDSSEQLTSADIFGDMLAEVEAESQRPPAATAESGPAALGMPSVKTRRRNRPQFDDIDRKLEETLSGVLPIGGKLKRPETAANRVPAAKAKSKPSEIDQLLDQTLSSIELPRIRRGRPRQVAQPTAAAAPPESPLPRTPAPTPTAAPQARPEPTVPEAEDEPGFSFTAPPSLAEPELPPAVSSPASFAEPEKPKAVASPVSFAEPEKPPAAPAISSPASFAEPEKPKAAPPAPAEDAFRTQLLPVFAQEPEPEPEESSILSEGQPFGDYTLLERIAVGGMAEVWKARRRGVEGFQKTVAIKKILAHLTGSPDFVTMFIDEAKLAAQLNHNNIIQIYDLGKVDDDFFIAMEYVDGVDLRTILQTSRRSHQLLSSGLAVLIAMSVARALDYAHRKRDFDNRDLGLVHRDVSPQNVLISYEGEIKLCDFGIVKAVVKASTTQMGALKGKLQYMSPEQAWGKPVDSRSDIFSLGSVLFEALTGRKLFSGDSEIGVLDAVRECRIRPPRKILPDLSEEVDRITRRALAKTPQERYQTAGEMEQDMKAFLVGLKPMPTQSDLAEFMHRLFKDPGRAPESAGPETPGARLQPAALPRPVAPSKPQAPAPAAAAPVPAPKVAAAPRVAAAPARPQVPRKKVGGQAKQGRGRLLAIAAVVAAVLVGALLLYFLRSGKATPEPAGVPAPVPAMTGQGPPEGGRSETGVPAAGAPVSGAPEQAGAPGIEASSGEGVAAEGAAAEGATAEGATAEGATAEGAASEGAASEGLEGAPVDFEELLEKAFDKKAEELTEDFEAQKRQLEKELEAARKASGEKDGGS